MNLASLYTSLLASPTVPKVVLVGCNAAHEEILTYACLLEGCLPVAVTATIAHPLFGMTRDHHWNPSLAFVLFTERAYHVQPHVNWFASYTARQTPSLRSSLAAPLRSIALTFDPHLKYHLPPCFDRVLCFPALQEIRAELQHTHGDGGGLG